MAAPRLFYFGCMGEPGHYLFSAETGGRVSRESELIRLCGEPVDPRAVMWKIDGGYAPRSARDQGAFRLVDIPPLTIVAWHDFTGDRRPNSNSAVIGLGYADWVDMLEDAAVRFPTMWKRQTAPLRMIFEG